MVRKKYKLRDGGICPYCEREFRRGETVVPHNGRYYHPQCYFKI